MIKVEWLATAERSKILSCLVEYRYLVGRFPQWLALAIGNSEDEDVRQLLLPNLIKEIGSPGSPSHLSLLDDCIRSCGIAYDREYAPRRSTRAIEGWFFGTFAGSDAFRALCVLGPGTEAISSSFLVPLSEGLTQAFTGIPLDMRYFEVHTADNEDEDARMIEEALSFLQERSPIDLAVERESVVRAAIAKHQQFWDSLRE